MISASAKLERLLSHENSLLKGPVMKTNPWPALLVLLGVVVGYFVGGGSFDKTARGQAPAAAAPVNAVARFQIQAWAYGDGSHPSYGCYIVDTLPGQLWHSAMGKPPKKVADELPRE
jgi:hypothetical protein